MSEKLRNRINEVVAFLLEGKTGIAIKKLHSLITEIKRGENDRDVIKEIENDIIRISNRFSVIDKSESFKDKTEEEIKIEKNSIVVALLSVIESIRQLRSISISVKENELKSGVFLKRSVDDMMEDICQYIDKAKSIRVIGASRQDKFKKEPIPTIKRYYDSIEKRCTHDFEGNHQLLYRRITNRGLSKETIRHIKKCFEGAEKNKNTFKVIFHGEIYLLYTYLIIDTIDGESILVLNLYTIDNDIEIFDTSIAYFTQDKFTINEYKKHFQNAWEKESERSTMLKNLKEFNFYSPFDSDIDDKINFLKKASHEIPKDSVRLEHLRYHLGEFGKRVGQLGSSMISVPHTDKNQRISTAYKWYINSLEKGCSYKTISVYEFWNGIQNLEKFLSRHRDRFENEKGSGSVTRIYVVDNNRIQDKKYISSQKDIIRSNFELAKEFSEYYDFLILFVDNYSRFLTVNRNCAIWSKDNKYRVVFLSRYPRDFSERGLTSIYFVEEWNNSSSVNLQNKQRYTRASNQIARSTKSVIKQNDKLRKYWLSNNHSHDKNESDVNSQPEFLQITFLQKCGVDIDRYLY